MIKKNQVEFRRNKKGTQKITKEKNTLYNIEMLYKARSEAIKFYHDYSLMLSEAKNKAKIKQWKVKDLKH